MKPSSDTAQDIARVLYDALISTAADQLLVAAQKLAGSSGTDGTILKRIEESLPPDTLPQVRNFLLSLANEGEMSRLSSIAQAFERYKSMAQIVTAEITSAIPLEPAQCEQITQELRSRYKEDLDIHFKVDNSLIGGLVIRVGDQVFDNSLRTRLGVVQRSMLTS